VRGPTLVTVGADDHAALDPWITLGPVAW
jgi:hypothetical protein